MLKPRAIELVQDMVVLLQMHDNLPVHFKDWVRDACRYLCEVDTALENIQRMDELAIEHFDQDKHEWKFQRLAREARKL